MDTNVECHSTFLSIILYLLSFYVPVALSVILPFFIKSIFRFGLDKLYFTVHRIESHVYFFQFQFISITAMTPVCSLSPSHILWSCVRAIFEQESVNWCFGNIVCKTNKVLWKWNANKTHKTSLFSLWIKHSFLELDFQTVSKVSTLSVCAVDRWVFFRIFSSDSVCVCMNRSS